MSLASIEKTVVTDVREGVQNAVNWLTQVVETHLPNAEADIKAVASSPLFRAVEAALLTPAEEAFVAEFISKIPSLRSHPQQDEPAGDVPADPENEPQPVA